jgi:hypothetical protein
MSYHYLEGLFLSNLVPIKARNNKVHINPKSRSTFEFEAIIWEIKLDSLATGYKSNFQQVKNLKWANKNQ